MYEFLDFLLACFAALLCVALVFLGVFIIAVVAAGVAQGGQALYDWSNRWIEERLAEKRRELDHADRIAAMTAPDDNLPMPASPAVVTEPVAEPRRPRLALVPLGPGETVVTDPFGDDDREPPELRIVARDDRRMA